MAPLTVQVRPHGSFAVGFDLLDPGGAAMGTFTGSVWRERGRVRVGGQEWDFRRERGRFVLAGPAGEVAAADRASLWTDRWRLSAGGCTYELVRPSWWARRYELRAGDVPVGRLSPKGIAGNRADVELPAELSAPVRVFVVAVVLAVWRRQSAAAATAG